ncbi:fluoride ion transporter CrcB [Verticiella sediminum]|uniref:Fluoride-specific ion channel FluC n=1 Tax=Verticiella sediminum TaxID=1247510 RepID=A0A556ABM0_9BURK|nr:CrcB family protein [Verticiella sediminum]TSH90270.1 fluoride ion transporter CrcB [Verticiella sediminum]
MNTAGSLFVIAVGAVFGAWARWGLAVWLNARSAWPWGTLTANLVGGYLVGVVLGLLLVHAHWPGWVRLALVTGFLGAFTTFSSFSAEVVGMLQAGRWLAGFGYAALSLLGSLGLTLLGLATAQWVLRA